MIQRKNEPLKIYGAGILSSSGESEYSLSRQPVKRKYDILEVINTDFDNTVIQDLYFVIPSFEEMGKSIQEILSFLKEWLKDIEKK